MESARSTDQTNPEQCRHLGVDKGSKEGDRTVTVRVAPTKDATQKLVEEYRAFVKSVASAANKSKFEQIQQGCIGLSTESGELLDNLKKSMFQERVFDEVNAKEECGDALFYITELLDAIGSDIFECIDLNMKKLTARYGDIRFNSDKSLNRDLGGERKILEGADQDCASCADTDCSSKLLPQRVCSGYINNRNYPVAPISQREAEQRKACCGNCAKRLTLEGCSRYVKTNNDGCCIDHKFL